MEQLENEGEILNSPSKIEGVAGGRGSMPVLLPESAQGVRRIKNDIALKQIRRNLRTNGTPAEGALWNILKCRKVAGLRFRRQYSIGDAVLDFYCPELKVAIELDGDYHFHGTMREKDLLRDERLWREHGIHTLRFENKVVFEAPRSIIASVENIVKMREGHTPSPLRGTPPISGGEFRKPFARQEESGKSFGNLS